MALMGFSCPVCHRFGCQGECQQNVVPMPKPKRHLRVIHRTGMGQLGALFADMDITDDFNLTNYVQAVRAAGYILNEHVYIPVDEIAGMLVWTEDKPPPQLNVVPFDGAKK